MVPVTRGRYLLPVTVIATFWLTLLGIYTAAIGAGLTCDGRWPLCDGAVFGLFPANWTSFVEWFHRLVAMITGFLILGSWWILWKHGRSRAAQIAMSVAVVLLPVQVWLGAETVFQYEILYLTAHFLNALIIFAALVAGTWWWSGRQLQTGDRARVLGGVLAILVPFVIMTPQFLITHSGTVQITYYGIGLLMFVGLLVVTLDAFSAPDPQHWRVGAVTGTGIFLLTVQLLAGRLVRSPLVHTIDWIGAILLVPLLILGLLLTRPLSSGRGYLPN